METTEHLENAESRYEKRWYQNQIDKRAKKLKQQEQARITTLVERAMAADPRLIQERKRLLEEKEQRQRQREHEAAEKKRKQIEAKLAEERRVEEEKERKNQEKLEREKEKKMLRKTKQVFKKLVAEALESLKKNEHALEDEVDLICSEFDRDQFLKLNANLESNGSPQEVFDLVKKRASNLLEKKQQQQQENKVLDAAKTNGNADEESTSTAKEPFTKDEMSALAKAVKKFPPGGANRWDQISSYINSVCRPEIPKTKERCIAIFNQYNKSKPAGQNGSVAKAAAPAPAPAVASSEDDHWTDEQDKQLQDGLVNYPASMDKNERWTSIAKGVPGKTKKQCVQRFKAIRDVIKNKS